MRLRLRIGICALVVLSLWITALLLQPRSAKAASWERGGIGVLGGVTGLGSIHVNGMRITYNPTLRVKTAFGSKSPTTIVPGHTVQIEAQERNGIWVARSIQRHQS